MQRYKVEPYVASADIYSMPPHVGRGGWTWYTGSAGWMYRAGLEWILGFQLRDKVLVIDPCIPRSWKGYELTYKQNSTTYEIKVENPNNVNRGVKTIHLDNQQLAASKARIPLTDDGGTHQVRIVLG